VAVSLRYMSRISFIEEAQAGSSADHDSRGGGGVKFLSVCSGIEAATVAWHPMGWQAFAYSEIEPFPSAVLAHHYPHTPNLGDMTKFKEWPNAAIDLLVGGTPCQSFSVAGLRKGLDDPRGNLMLTYLAIADKYRPQWLVWENVPGVLSSNKGRDFGTFLAGLGQLGYGFAYRVLDAQYYGVAQRRRRVFVVGCLGNWRAAAAVLFERQSLSGDSAQRREAGKAAPALPSRSSAGGGLGTDFDLDGGLIAGTLQAAGKAAGSATQQDAHAGLLIAHSLRGEGFYASEDGAGGGTPLVPVAFSCKDYGADAGDIAPTLRAMGHGESHANAGGQVAVAYGIRTANTSSNGWGVQEEVTHTLDRAQPPAIAFAQNQRDEVRTMGVAMALAAEPGAKQQTYIAQTVGWSEELTAHQDLAGTIQRGGNGGRHDGVMTPTMQVRRLTPRECERLQGFPDDYTAILFRGKPAADSPRYKALGNSMAVPVMRKIGERIQLVSDVMRLRVAA
jgi:DNA (cytosine-5)-methyltransferase 1